MTQTVRFNKLCASRDPNARSCSTGRPESRANSSTEAEPPDHVAVDEDWMTGSQTLHVIHSKCNWKLTMYRSTSEPISGDDIRHGSLVRSTVNVCQVELWILYTVHWHVAMQRMINGKTSTAWESRNPKLKAEKFGQDSGGQGGRTRGT